ncbi:MAG: plastocyanin/azurin family copper-binding protein [Acidimicrobiia bacterium]
MTDTPSGDEEHAAGTGPDVPADQPIAISVAVGTGTSKPVKDRFLLPLLVPVLSAIAVGVLAVNISRVFLAGSSQAALFLAIFVTLSILGGASLLAAAPHMRTSSLAMVTGLIIVIVTGAGLLTLGPSLGHEGGAPACTAPSGPPVGNLNVEALSTIKFNATNYDVPAGIVSVNYSGAPGHTLAFREPNVLCVELHTPGPPNTEKVLLKAGQTYNIYCTLPGHAAAGMEATVTVAAS